MILSVNGTVWVDGEDSAEILADFGIIVRNMVAQGGFTKEVIMEIVETSLLPKEELRSRAEDTGFSSEKLKDFFSNDKIKKEFEKDIDGKHIECYSMNADDFMKIINGELKADLNEEIKGVADLINNVFKDKSSQDKKDFLNGIKEKLNKRGVDDDTLKDSFGQIFGDIL